MQTIKNVVVVWKALLSSASPLALFSLIALPLALVFVSFVSFFLDSLVQQYTYKLEKSYAGLQGRLTVSSDVHAISIIDEALAAQGVETYQRSVESSVIYLSAGDQKVLKYVQLLVLTDADYEKKFPDAKKKLVVNKVFDAQLGDYRDQVSSVRIDPERAWYGIPGLAVIDTGFLTNRALVFMPESIYRTLLPDKALSFTELEVSNANTQNIERIKNDIFSIVGDKALDSVMISDLFEKTSEARKQFANLSFGQQVVLCLTMLLAVSAVTSACSLLLDLKARSLGILSRLGLDRGDIALAIVLLGFVIFLLSLLLSYLCFMFSYPALLAKISTVSGFRYELSSIYLYVFLFMFLWLAIRAWQSASKVELSPP